MLLYKQITKIEKTQLSKDLKFFLKEDIPNVDLTTEHTISPNSHCTAILAAREKMVFCGQDIINNIFSKKIKIINHVKDGDQLEPGTKIASLMGSTKEILIKERLILNLIQRLSGISTTTKHYVSALDNNNIHILDTRKTTPGLRYLEKYAVYIGGGSNHRMNLSSGFLIKDNHIANNKKIDRIVEKLSQKRKEPLQVEIDSIKQLTPLLINTVDGFLLDNMSATQLKKCIHKINKHNKTQKQIFIEASGGITIKNIKKYDIPGINGISIGALTHHIKSIDIGLDIQ